MLNVYFSLRVVRRLQAEPEAVLLAEFLGYLHGRGHARLTIQQYVRTAELFLRWLRRRHLSLNTVEETVVRRFVCRRRCSHQTAYAALRHLLRHLRSEGRVSARASTTRPVAERVVNDYDAHLAQVCGLAAATRLYRRRYAREFMLFVFGSKRIEWRRLRAEQVQNFVAQFGGNGRFAAAQVAAVSVRSFLRWLQYLGRVDARLVEAVPHFRQWRLATLPTVMSEVQWCTFLKSFDRSRPSGRRDYAMALCMVTLGLRVGEVAGLRLDDLDLAAGTVRLRPGKVRRERLLPLTACVRQALVAYIRGGRPRTDDPCLFVRHRIPVGAAVTRELIRGVMRRAYAVVPGCEGWTGTHVLRHTAATRLRNAGADLKRVADILGHRTLDTTAIYTKVDLPQLAEVALPWPGTQEAR
jgi:integrase/recombinase XerD